MTRRGRRVGPQHRTGSSARRSGTQDRTNKRPAVRRQSARKEVKSPNTGVTGIRTFLSRLATLRDKKLLVGRFTHRSLECWWAFISSFLHQWDTCQNAIVVWRKLKTLIVQNFVPQYGLQMALQAIWHGPHWHDHIYKQSASAVASSCLHFNIYDKMKISVGRRLPIPNDICIAACRTGACGYTACHPFQGHSSPHCAGWTLQSHYLVPVWPPCDVS